jgi:hypothetical protein
VLVTVAEVVLAELPRAVAQLLQQLGERRVALIDADRRTGQADRVQTGADRQLSGDEGRAPRRAAGLRVMIGEEDPFAPDAVNVGRWHHHAVAVDADVFIADVVGHDDQDVGTLCVLRQRRYGKEAARGRCERQEAPDGPKRGHACVSCV